MSNSPLALVTGASGFVGGKIVDRLLAEGRSVRAFSRRPLPELEARGVEVALGELSDSPSLHAACAGVDSVFHVAAQVGVWGPAKEFHAVNVDGTARLLEAAITNGVRRLVHTSSPSVVYTGGDLRGVDESARLCTQAPCAYPPSKALAERLVRAANCPNLRTVALRPHLVWGPGDHHLVPRVVASARKGRLRVVGRGENRVDLTHIDNVVDAHLLAERALAAPRSPAGGRAYFITNGEPVALWPWINDLLVQLGLPPLRRRIPVGTAAAIGSVCETLWRILPLRGEPPMTAFAAHELATDHWFSIEAARRDLGYEPRISMAAGLEAYLPQLRTELGL
jgi:nucleoside-diphosphate-sugar epimerase